MTVLPINIKTNGIILMYHRVANDDCDPWNLSVSPSNFAMQMEVLKQTFYPIKLSDLCAPNGYIDIPSPWVACTFDDGYADNYYNASEILKQFEMPATFFIVSGYLKSMFGYWWDELIEIFLKPGSLPPFKDLSVDWSIDENEWNKAILYTNEDFEHYRYWHWEDDKPSPRHKLFSQIYDILRPLAEEQRQIILRALRQVASDNTQLIKHQKLLTNNQVKELALDDLFEFGAHSLMHNDLRAVPSDQLRYEIINSKEILEKLIGKRIDCFSYPFGINTEEVIETLADSGFRCAVGVQEGIVHKKTNRFLLPRFEVGNWDSGEFYDHLVNYLLRYHNFLKVWDQDFRPNKRSFMLGFHSIKHLVEKEATITSLQDQSSLLSEKINGTEQDVLRLKNEINSNEEKILRLETQINSNEAKILRLETEINTNEVKILRLETEINSNEVKILRLEQEVLYYALSRSWRITRPLRKLIKMIKGI